MADFVSITKLIEEKTIVLEGFDPFSSQGFTQIPNALLRDKKLSPSAKLCYSMLLSYAWQKEACFPGQEKLGEDIGMTRKSVYRFLKELERFGYLETKRRGLGKTNVYVLKCKIKRK